MLRLIAPALTLLLLAPLVANAASKQEYELNKTLVDVAAQSTVGTPRVISQGITDNGYTAEGSKLINHLSVESGQADKMRDNPELVGHQLGTNVCSNVNFRKLMSKGATLVYEFTEETTNKPITVEKISAADCAAKPPAKKK